MKPDSTHSERSQHLIVPLEVDLDGTRIVGVCGYTTEGRVCGKRIFRPEQRDFRGDGRPSLLPWKHRTEKYHYPTSKPVEQIPGQLALFNA